VTSWWLDPGRRQEKGRKKSPRLPRPRRGVRVRIVERKKKEGKGEKEAPIGLLSFALRSSKKEGEKKEERKKGGTLALLLGLKTPPHPERRRGKVSDGRGRKGEPLSLVLSLLPIPLGGEERKGGTVLVLSPLFSYLRGVKKKEKRGKGEKRERNRGHRSLVLSLFLLIHRERRKGGEKGGTTGPRFPVPPYLFLLSPLGTGKEKKGGRNRKENAAQLRANLPFLPDLGDRKRKRARHQARTLRLAPSAKRRKGGREKGEQDASCFSVFIYLLGGKKKKGGRGKKGKKRLGLALGRAGSRSSWRKKKERGKKERICEG